ncbi:SPRY [Seminavis robusta]|uniref:SPRY n=1 Tax=Seminavis robusta TaxID=568900 RepID=A0A9N8F193_9STRA|nr:SPRY [Seminavis robusta]|eukprot:Sro3058_g342880.1 SPRY (391) ;mRNA; r:1883-3217
MKEGTTGIVALLISISLAHHFLHSSVVSEVLFPPLAFILSSFLLVLLGVQYFMGNCQKPQSPTSISSSTGSSSEEAQKDKTQKMPSGDSVFSKFLILERDDISVEIFQWLDSRDLVACSQVSKGFRHVLRTSSNHAPGNFLWYCLYCTKYRAKFVTPPSFEALLQGTTCSNTELPLDAFSWKELVLQRQRSANYFTPGHPCIRALPTELQIAAGTQPGMLDIVNTTRPPTQYTVLFGSMSAVVFQRHVRDMALPLSNRRSIAYIELYVRGGGSCGLVSSGRQPRTFGRQALNAHIGWAPGSIGYHGDAGYIFCCSEEDGRQFGTISMTGESSEASARTCPGFAKGTYCYFAVCLHDQEEFCSVNFGTQRFVFDIEKYSQLPLPTETTLQL